jgi:hypothetical protein
MLAEEVAELLEMGGTAGYGLLRHPLVDTKE